MPPPTSGRLHAPPSPATGGSKGGVSNAGCRRAYDKEISRPPHLWQTARPPSPTTTLCASRLCEEAHQPRCASSFAPPARKVNVRLPGKGDSNSHDARSAHQIISMMKWTRTSRLPIKNSLSLRHLFRVWGAGFRIGGLGFRVHGLGIRDSMRLEISSIM
jgi:hypothetical protein